MNFKNKISIKIVNLPKLELSRSSSSVDGTLTIKRRNQIIQRTIVDFAVMSYLFAKLEPFT